jgi:SAM-dependent methyltransferase
MDVYYALTQKRDVIGSVASKHFYGDLLDIGCGEMQYKELIESNVKLTSYTGMDIENPIYQKEIQPDVFWDGKEIPLKENSYDSAILIEVLEHVPEPQEVLDEISRVLKEGGKLLITVPFLWNLHDTPNDEFRYTPFSLARFIEKAGFEVIEMKRFGGWHGSFATMLAIYIKRGIQGRHKKILGRLAMPLISWLHKKDDKYDKADFSNGQMITGIWCVVEKKKNS